ncbi:hypothetical protein C8R42DRAFT_647560 [Lentinula raphanica]|nr:hypothetical protein C8R42DRAFT_727923 [Lentinula raphanica]KAJ3712403.1 hypothetical protein C8R42DRAFT_647560 [Lentinula raphanica]
MDSMHQNFLPTNNSLPPDNFTDGGANLSDPFWKIPFDFNDPAFDGLDFDYAGAVSLNADLGDHSGSNESFPPPSTFQDPVPTLAADYDNQDELPTSATTDSNDQHAVSTTATDVEKLLPPISAAPDLSPSSTSSLLEKALEHSGPFPKHRPTTHADRNPLLPTQERRQRPPKRVLTPAQLRTMQEGKAAKQRQNLLLKTDILDLLDKHEQAIEELASKHSVEADYIKKLIIPVTKLKEKKAVGRRQALVYMKGKEVNEGLAAGSRLKAPALNRLVEEDDELLSISDEKLQEVIKEIEENRILSTSGTRPSNLSAGKDFQAMSVRFHDEFEKLHLRTGAMGFGFLVPGTSDCKGTPTFFFAGKDSPKFVRQQLNLEMWDLLHLLELWAHSSQSSKPPTFLERKNECANIIASGLRYILRNKSAKMNYENYHRSVVAQHHIRIIGLPDSLPDIVNPHTISNKDTLQALHAALQSGTCRWAAMNSDEVEQHQKWMESESAEGRTVGRQRAERSDKGKKRGRRGDQVVTANEDENGDPPRKRQKKSAPTLRHDASRHRERVSKQLPPQFKSREFIDDDDDESGSDDDNDGVID